MTIDEVRRRASRLAAESRNEMFAVLAATVAVVVLSWRFRFSMGLAHDLAFAAALLWALGALAWFRRRLWPSLESPGLDSLTAPGLDHYRAILQDRRAHLRASWAWRGPAVLALALFIWPVFARAPSWSAVAPFTMLVVAWAAASLIQARSQLRALDLEIRGLESMR